MSDERMLVLYDLRSEHDIVRAVQSVSRRGEGLSDRPALIGSDLWWRLVNDAELPSRVVTGTVARSYWSGHGDYPQFDLVDDAGAVTTWERYGDETRYVPGLAVRLRYVEHPRHRGIAATVVVLVEIEESDLREVGHGKHR